MAQLFQHLLRRNWIPEHTKMLCVMGCNDKPSTLEEQTSGSPGLSAASVAFLEGSKPLRDTITRYKMGRKKKSQPKCFSPFSLVFVMDSWQPMGWQGNASNHTFPYLVAW